MKKIKYIALVLCTMFAMEGTAQTSKSAYFLDGTFNNFMLNPAMRSERGFFSLGVGNTTIGTNGNVGISHFLFPQGDHLTTFMSSTVSESEFLGRLPQSIRFGMNLDETILGLGFRMFGGYTSFGVTLHSSTSMALPKGFFEFAKKGLQEKYNFSGININTKNYAAATIGYSHEIYEGLSFGVNLKFLTGLAYADATFDKFNIEMSADQWMIEAHAKAQAAVGVEIGFIDDEETIDNIELKTSAPAATGFAMDFGLVYDMYNIAPGLTLSASILDLGKINWKQMMSIENGENSCIRWEGLTEGNINDLEGAFNKEFEKLEEAATQMMEFKTSDFREEITKLNATMYLGAEYEMPFYSPLSVAVLYGKQFSPHAYSGWKEVRGYVNWAPIKWLEFTANAGKSTFNTCWGWMINFHPRLISFFIGSDYMISTVTSQYIPLPVNDLNYHITFGLVKPIGRRK